MRVPISWLRDYVPVDMPLPELAERLVLPPDWVVLRCTSAAAPPVEIAMARTTLTGFMSWIEAAPPGGASIRFAAR